MGAPIRKITYSIVFFCRIKNNNNNDLDRLSLVFFLPEKTKLKRRQIWIEDNHIALEGKENVIFRCYCSNRWLSLYSNWRVNPLFDENYSWRRTNESMFNIVSLRFLGNHKWCTATVTLRERPGKVTIKSPFVQTSVNDILYFTRIIHRFVCRTNFGEFIGFLLVINCCIHLKS